MRNIAIGIHILFFVLGIEAQKKPNVIVIMTDDMGNNTRGLGNPWLKTPHIDKLQKESIELTNFHQAILCTPSRAGLMTGKYALRTGAWRTSIGRSHMRTEEITMAEVFKENGYKTGQFGKWHLGDDWPFRASDQGFDEVVNFKCGAISQISDYWGNDYFDDVYYHNDKPEQYKGYCTDVFFNETMRFIKETKDTPFMIYLAPNVAHLPAIVGEEYSKPFKDKGHDEKQAIYYGMIANLDENMGYLMAFLEEQGIADDTILVFTTDDGTAGYAARHDKEGRALKNGYNMGQRGGKSSPYDGGHRLFSFVKWKGGNLEGGKKVDQLTTVFDIFPTLTDLCGIASSKELDQDGISFKSALYGKEIKENKDRSIFLTKLHPAKPLNFKRNLFCVVDGDWRWINRKELYNVKNDRDQRNDIAGQYPDICEKLDKKLAKYLKKNAGDRETPVRFLLGDYVHKKISLTTQDLWGHSVFTQGHVGRLDQGEGPWKVTFVNEGTYKITLSRFPLYTGMAFNAKTNGKKSKDFTASRAKLSLNKNTFEKDIVATDTHVSFEIVVKSGDMDLETWISSKEGITVPAYFVDVELIK